MKVLIARFGPILALSSLLLAGCGGGGGGGGVSPPPPPPPPPPPSGGITRTGVGFAAGPITDFGSVWVNGVEYETSGAEFRRDGNLSSEIEFEKGETVIVKGTIDDSTIDGPNPTGVAQTVELDELVKGPATDIVSPTTAIVMGQTVNSTAGTWVDNNCAPATFDDLTGLDGFFAVEVYGIVQPDGTIDATRIECKLAAEVAEFEVNGVVSGHVPGTSFMINGLEVNYATANTGNDFPGGVISNGDPVEVKGTNFTQGAAPDPDVLVATRVEYKGNRLDGNEGDHYEIEGFITNFGSATQFDVRVGSLLIPVTTDGNTQYEPAGASAADLNNNLKIEVEGEDDGTGRIQATKIEVKSATNIRVTGLVDAGSVGTNTFRVMNIVVNTIPGTTRFEDGSDVPSDPTVIAVDDYLEVRGQEQPEGQITALIVKRDDFRPDRTDQFDLRGFVTAKARPNLTVLGVTIETNGATQYRDVDDSPMVADDFWAAVTAGVTIVDAKGDRPNPAEARLVAEELELESQ